MSTSNTDYRPFILECLKAVPRASIDVLLRAYLQLSWEDYLKRLPQPASLKMRDDFRDVAEALWREGLLKKEDMVDVVMYQLSTRDTTTLSTGAVTKKPLFGVN